MIHTFLFKTIVNNKGTKKYLTTQFWYFMANKNIDHFFVVFCVGCHRFHVQGTTCSHPSLACHKSQNNVFPFLSIADENAHHARRLHRPSFREKSPNASQVSGFSMTYLLLETNNIKRKIKIFLIYAYNP